MKEDDVISLADYRRSGSVAEPEKKGANWLLIGLISGFVVLVLAFVIIFFLMG